MSGSTKKSERSRQLLSLMAAAVLAASAGLAVAPSRAQAKTPDAGWTCYQTDRCHAGSAACCMDPDSEIFLTHCTTVC